MSSKEFISFSETFFRFILERMLCGVEDTGGALEQLVSAKSSSNSKSLLSNELVRFYSCWCTWGESERKSTSLLLSKIIHGFIFFRWWKIFSSKSQWGQIFLIYSWTLFSSPLSSSPAPVWLFHAIADRYDIHMPHFTFQCQPKNRLNQPAFLKLWIEPLGRWFLENKSKSYLCINLFNSKDLLQMTPDYPLLRQELLALIVHLRPMLCWIRSHAFLFCFWCVLR